MTARESSGAAGFPPGISECARLLREHDWRLTALGPIADWSPSLCAVTSMMLLSPAPMLILWGAEGILLYNDAYAVIAGARHPALFGRSVREGWPEMAAFNDHVVTTVLAGGTLTFREWEMHLHHDGERQRIWVDLEYSPLLDETGVPAGVLAIVTDRTRSVLAVRQLAAQHERFRTMFDQAPGFTAMLEGPDHRFSFVNHAYTKMMNGRDVVGRAVHDAVPEAMEHGLTIALDTAYRTGKPFVARDFKFIIPDRHGRPEEHYLDFVYQPIRDADGAVCGIFAQGFDVTERVLAEEALRRSRQEFRELNDALIMANDILSSVSRAQPGSGA